MQANLELRDWALSLYSATSEGGHGPGYVYDLGKDSQGKRSIETIAHSLLVPKEAYRKLTMKEIVSISRELAGPHVIKQMNEQADLFSTKPIKSFEDDLMSLCMKIKACNEISKALGILSDKTTLKHTVEKTKSIWGYVKWLIWSYFYDQSKEISKIQNSIVEPAIFYNKIELIIEKRLKSITKNRLLLTSALPPSSFNSYNDEVGLSSNQSHENSVLNKITVYNNEENAFN